METKGIHYPAKANSACEGTDRKDSLQPKIENVWNVDNLFNAYLKARKGKRSKLAVFKFEQNLMENLNKLSEELKEGTYKPLEPRKFSIKCNVKTRQIAAPAFRDSVVQHAIYNEVYDTFDRGFIHDSYGCRLGKGNRRASDRLQKFMRQSPSDSYFIQIDMKKFYHSIDHSVLEESIHRKIKDSRLANLIISFCTEPDGKGLNIGFLLSQLKGLIYLDRFDHFVKRKLKVNKYIRYVDDCVLVGLKKEECKDILNRCVDFLKTNLKLSLSKWIISPIRKGINFVGFRTWRSRRFIRKRSLQNFSLSLKKRKLESIQSILSHALDTSSYFLLLNKVRNSRDHRLMNSLPKRFRNDFQIQ